jgi:predicted rRNA methylase YqxC with S4 and FtsJ domains
MDRLISLTLILPVLQPFTQRSTHPLLVKPQFEAKEHVEKAGSHRSQQASKSSKSTQRQSLERFSWIDSPILGAETKGIFSGAWC